VELRTQFQGKLAPLLQTPERLIFLDESGFNTAMTRRYARAPSHQRAAYRVPRNWGKNHTLICTLGLTGPAAPLVVEGSVNGAVFEWYVREVLCPILEPGQVVVLDNLSSHHRASVQTLIEAQACEVMFLPPYSPDFNPIELMFSKLKALLRGQARRTVDALLAALGVALDAITGQEAAHWFKHAYPMVSL
jgi:transposase